MMCKQCLGLQRKIKAMEEFIESKGFVLNSKDDEWRKAELPPYELDNEGYPVNESWGGSSWEMGELFDREREVKG